MTVAEALVAWQAGEITARRAMVVTGATNVLELYALLEIHGIETRFDLSEVEQRSVEAVMATVDRNHLQNEFFAFLQSQDEKWELVDGKRERVAAKNQRHQDIAADILDSLRTQLKGSPLRATGSGTGVGTPNGDVRFPDIVVDGGQRNDDSMLATAPRSVIEILSQSKHLEIDRRLADYLAVASIAFVMLVDADGERCVVHGRGADGWIATRPIGVEVAMELLPLMVTLTINW